MNWVIFLSQRSQNASLKLRGVSGCKHSRKYKVECCFGGKEDPGYWKDKCIQCKPFIVLIHLEWSNFLLVFLIALVIYLFLRGKYCFVHSHCLPPLLFSAHVNLL